MCEAALFYLLNELQWLTYPSYSPCTNKVKSSNRECCAVLITTSPYVTVQHGRSVKDARQYTHGQYVQCSKRAASPCTHSSGTGDLTGTLLLGKAEAKPSQLPPSFVRWINNRLRAFKDNSTRLDSRSHRCMNYDDQLLLSPNPKLTSSCMIIKRSEAIREFLKRRYSKTTR